jgi:hypothetical protein
VQDSLDDDEKAIMVMARQMDEDLRAKVRVIRMEAEEAVAAIQREVRYIYVTHVTHMAGGVLRIYHTRHSHGRRCVTYMRNPSSARSELRPRLKTLRLGTLTTRLGNRLRSQNLFDSLESRNRLLCRNVSYYRIIC